jgi:hypothetical protein
MKRKKNILSLENKKRGKYPFFFRREKLLRTSIIIEIIALPPQALVLRELSRG